MYNKTVLRIILSSPSDLSSERKTVVAIVDEINNLYKSKKIGLELVLWEQDVSPRTDLQPGQKNVDTVLNYKEADLLIGLFYKKLGTPTLGSKSGTIHEIDEAINAFKLNGSPEIKLYFKIPDLSSHTKEIIDEYSRVLEMKKQYMDMGGIIQEFKKTSEFEQFIRKHILEFIGIKEKALFGREDLLSDPIMFRQSPELPSFRTVTSVFSNLEKYLKERDNNDSREIVFGFGVDMQVSLPNIEYLLNSYAKNITFKILVLSPDVQLGLIESEGEGYFDPDTLRNAIVRLKKIKSVIGKNGNRIVIKSSNYAYPFHGMMINEDLYMTLLNISFGKILTPDFFVKIQKGINSFLDNLVLSFSSWFDYFWNVSDLIFDSDSDV